MSTLHHRSKSSESDALLQPSRAGRDGRSISNAGAFSAKSGISIGPQGNFNTDFKSTATPRSAVSRQDYFGTYTAHRLERDDDDVDTSSEQRQAQVRDKINREVKIKTGSENLLEALNFKNSKQTKDQRLRVESELIASNRKIAELKHELHTEVQKSRDLAVSPSGQLAQLFHGQGASSPRGELDFEEEEDDTESPTYVLVELLQSLEARGLPSDYYVEHANNLAELLKRHPSLKYDLVWSIFGVRVQGMLLSDSRDVAAAGYRLMRYAITDRKSLSVMRSFQTDYFVILSLGKESKASVEREQALKFVRAFIDVKNGVEEISRAIVRIIVAIAEQHDDRMRNICVLTLSEILIRKPALIVAAAGMGPLTDALAEGHYQPSESLTCAFLYLLETPTRRRFLKSGFEIAGPLAAFTDAGAHHSEERLKINAKVVASLLKTWSGLIALSGDDFMSIRSLIRSLHLPYSISRDIVLDIILDILRIKPPSWSSSFLAGRRLTTYGGLAKAQHTSGEASPTKTDDTNAEKDLVDHFTALVLAIFLKCGLFEALLFVLQNEKDDRIKRKTSVLMGEALEMVDVMLPASWTMQLQVLPELFIAAAQLGSDKRFTATANIYQIDRVNRTMYRNDPRNRIHSYDGDATNGGFSARRPSDLNQDQITPQIEEGVFRNLVMDTQILNSANWTKWRWDLVLKIIEGPLLNAKRLDEAMRATKFVKRLFGFYRPFKYRFSDVRNTKPNQRYVRIGCALIKTLLASPEGIKYLAENKLLRQIAECLAQVDRLSGLTSSSPLFSEDRLSETLSGGYFALLGALSSNVNGLLMLDRWRIINMFYHIVELEGRDDLIKTLLLNMDYTLDSHLRVILSKALTSCSNHVRVSTTRLLRKYAIMQIKDDAISSQSRADCASWAIDLLITQLYDPDIEVCEAAIKILEEACNRTNSLEYIVQCRPALDHLGEIGAPLLLRFLSTSIGYHYLDGLDYISQEMDDWFLGRNDSYVGLVETSISRALSGSKTGSRSAMDDLQEESNLAVTPPHFYRELTRTAEGCRLLESKGHFREFVSMIRELSQESLDAEAVVKMKGCMWAVGNVGSMELGTPFLEDSDVVELIIKIAHSSELMSMRGTAVFVLGLISKSIHGQEMLIEYGWDVAVDDYGQSIGICLPQDLSKLLTMPPLPRHAIVPETIWTNVDAASLLQDEDPTNARILALVADLGNTVLAKARAGELHSLKAKKAAGFGQAQLFRKVMSIFDGHHFRLPVLRFVIDLFDKGVLRQIVLDDESDDDFDTTLKEEQ